MEQENPYALHSPLWRAWMEKHAWKPSDALAKSPEGYARELDWNCLIELRVHARGPAGSVQPIRALVFPMAWKALSESSVKVKPTRWARVMERVAEQACKWLKTREQRRLLGNDHGLVKAMAKACAKDGAWLARTMGAPGPAELVIGPIHPDGGYRQSGKEGAARITGLRVVMELPAFRSQEGAALAMGRAKAGLEEAFGRRAVVERLAFDDEPPKLPTQDEWHALWVAAELGAAVVLPEPGAERREARL